MLPMKNISVYQTFLWADLWASWWCFLHF